MAPTGPCYHSHLARALESVDSLDAPREVPRLSRRHERRIVEGPASQLAVGKENLASGIAAKSRRESLADAIDQMLERQPAMALPYGVAMEGLHGRSPEPYSALEAALALTLQSRERIGAALSVLSAVEGGANEAAPASPDGRSGTRAFGRQLAEAWSGTLRQRSRSSLLSDLGHVEAARVGGLLKHLEWTVEAHPDVSAASLLDLQERSGGATSAHPLVPETSQGLQLPPPPPDIATASEYPFRHFQQPSMTSLVGQPTAPDQFNPEQIMAFRRRMEAVHGSMSVGFKAMDVSQRGLISFGDFHAHLVRLHLCKVDAESSRKALELFKQLDVDLDDFISPKDVTWALALASKAGASEADDRWQASLRFPTRPQVNAEEALNFVTFQRYLEARFGSFLGGLHAMDMEGLGQISKASFTRQLLQAGYCTSVEEAVALFKALDIHSHQVIVIKEIAALEASGELWLDLPIAPVLQAFDSGPAYHGGFFSEPGRLSDPPPLRRMRQRSRGASPDAVTQRLAAATTGQRREDRTHPSYAVSSQRKTQSAFVDAEQRRLPGRSPARTNQARSDSAEGKAGRQGDSKSARSRLGAAAAAASRAEAPARPPAADPPPSPPKVPSKAATSAEKEAASKKEEEPDLTKAKEVKSVEGLKEAVKDAQAAASARDRLRQRRQKKEEKVAEVQSGEKKPEAAEEQGSSFFGYLFGGGETAEAEGAASKPAAEAAGSKEEEPRAESASEAATGRSSRKSVAIAKTPGAAGFNVGLAAAAMRRNVRARSQSRTPSKDPAAAEGSSPTPDAAATSTTEPRSEAEKEKPPGEAPKASIKSVASMRSGGASGFNVGFAAAAMRRNVRARSQSRSATKETSATKEDAAEGDS